MSRLITVNAPWTLLNGNGDSITFNERTVSDPWPADLAPEQLQAFAWLQSVKGLRALPDLDDNREDNTEANGEQRFKEYARGKTLSCTAQIYGRTFVEAHEGADAALRVLSPLLSTGVVQGLIVFIAPTIAGAADQTAFGCSCRSGEAVENIVVNSATKTPSPFWLDLTFDLRMNDARFPSWDPVAETFGAAKW